MSRTRIAVEVSPIENEYSKIIAFYRECAYVGDASPFDTYVLAFEQGRILGLLRLAREDGVLVLRGMEVAASEQRKGIGMAILREADRLIGEQECYGICFGHLRDFYGAINFHLVDEIEAPLYLAARIRSYKARADGKDYRLMKRTSRNKETI